MRLLDLERPKIRPHHYCFTRYLIQPIRTRRSANVRGHKLNVDISFFELFFEMASKSQFAHEEGSMLAEFVSKLFFKNNNFFHFPSCYLHFKASLTYLNVSVGFSAGFIGSLCQKKICAARLLRLRFCKGTIPMLAP